MKHIIINSNNYEAFLLLYIDNELSVQERAAVEDYVATNTVAKAELDILKESILPGETNITFEHKHLLHKKATGITLANYEEYFVLYIDDELSKTGKEEVEHFVLTHPPLQTVFEQLLKSRLTPEPIVFNNKQALYKHEKKVYPMYWARLAVAASLIGIAAFLYIVAPGTNTNKQSIADNSNTTPVTMPVTTTAPAAEVADTTAQGNNPLIQPKQPVLPNQPPMVEYATSNNSSSTVQKQRTVKQPLKNSVATVVVENSSPQFANTTAMPIVENHLPNTITVAPAQPTQANATLASAPVTNQTATAAIVSHAVYKVLDTKDDDANNVLLLGSAQINKTKLKGLLRKASSLFERKTERKENDKTIKIASFEL